MMKTAIAISPIMKDVLSVAAILPAAVTASHMARIAPRIVGIDPTVMRDYERFGRLGQ